MKAGDKFAEIRDDGTLALWEVTDISHDGCANYGLMPFGASLDEKREQLKAVKENNSFVSAIQSLTLEKFAKMTVRDDWFQERKIIMLDGNPVVTAIFSCGTDAREELRLIAIADENHLESVLEHIRREYDYSQQEMERHIRTKKVEINNCDFSGHTCE